MYITISLLCVYTIFEAALLSDSDVHCYVMISKLLYPFFQLNYGDQCQRNTDCDEYAGFPPAPQVSYSSCDVPSEMMWTGSKCNTSTDV
jgi:hypothetical protein